MSDTQLEKKALTWWDNLSVEEAIVMEKKYGLYGHDTDTTEDEIVSMYSFEFVTNRDLILDKELSSEERTNLLCVLYGFNVEDDVIIDDSGDEFYGNSDNEQFEFNTLSDFFEYTAHISKKEGYSNCQYAMRGLLGFH